MQVKEVMSSGCESVKVSNSLSLAAQAMREHDIGDVFVYEEGDKIVGILTDRDITVRAIAEGASPTAETRQFMSSKRSRAMRIRT
jgi:CBS domain-containing protein